MTTSRSRLKALEAMEVEERVPHHLGRKIGVKEGKVANTFNFSSLLMVRVYALLHSMHASAGLVDSTNRWTSN